MGRTDREDATARALDLLPHDDAAQADPRIVRDPELAELARTARETAADVWLATSPLRAAPPDVLQAVMERAEAQAPLAQKNTRFFPWLAASGWAAAAIAVMLWPREESRPSADPPAVVANPRPTPPPTKSHLREGSDTAPAEPVSRERRLREDLVRLQARLAMIDQEAILTAPRVLALSSPGGARRSPEESRARVLDILKSALRSSLEVESGAPNDPATLVIERGWLPDALEIPDDGSLIRHRHFPERSWRELGLMRNDDGSYYDPGKDLIWTPDPENRGFIGQHPTDDDDLAGYSAGEESVEWAASPVRSEPEGFVIEDPITNLAEVVIDQVPPPEEGAEQFVEWTDASGASSTMRIDPTLSGAAGAEVPPTEAEPAGGSIIAPGRSGERGRSTLILAIPNSGGVVSFQLVERAANGNGQAARIIVSGERPRNPRRLTR